MKPTLRILTLAACGSLLSAPIAHAQEYDLFDLGAIAYDTSRAHDINESGQITGDTLNAAGKWRAFVWTNGSFTEVPALTGYAGDYGYGKGINNLGQVVGESGYTNPFLWDGVNTIVLGNLGGADSGAARAINDLTQVVGYASDTSGYDHAFLWENGVMTDLGTLMGNPYGKSEALDINNAGQIVGVSETSSGPQHAFLWENGVMTDLGGVGQGYSVARAISENGFIAGASDVNFRSHATLWAGGSAIDLGTLKFPDPGASEARDVNNLGQVVGWSHAHNTFNRHAFLFDSGVLKDLNDLIDPGTGWELEEAYAINDSGRIVGYGHVQGYLRGFLLVPRTTNGLQLADPVPGIAGRQNSLLVTEAAPGAPVYFAYGFQGGSTPVPGCSGLFVGINNPVVARPVTADALGHATLVQTVAARASGWTVLIQAIEPSACSVSNLVSFRFQ